MSRSLEFQRQTPVWRTEHPPNGAFGSETEYAAGYDPSPLHPEYTWGANVMVRGARTGYQYDGDRGRDILNSSPYPDIGGTDLQTWQRGEGHHGQRSLFDVKHEHPYVSWMGTHPDMRGHIPTLLGVAAMQTRARYGEPLRSDTSLSAESQKIVDRAASAGAVQMPAFVSRNSISSSEDRFNNYAVNTKAAGGGRDIPEPEVAMGRQFVRATLRAAKKPVQAPIRTAAQAKQGKLFGR